MNSRLVRVLLAIGAVIFAAALPACNTTKGVGQDLESAGGHVEHAAKNNGAQ